MSGTKEGGKKAQKTNKKRYGADFYKSIGSEGGKSHSASKSVETIYERYGKDYFSLIGKKGGQNRHKRTSSLSYLVDKLLNAKKR